MGDAHPTTEAAARVDARPTVEVVEYKAAKVEGDGVTVRWIDTESGRAMSAPKEAVLGMAREPGVTKLVVERAKVKVQL